MYSIKIKMNHPVTEKQKSILIKIIKEADEGAECRIAHTLLEISGGNKENDGLEKLSYLLGVAVGGSSSNEIVKLSLIYEK